MRYYAIVDESVVSSNTRRQLRRLFEPMGLQVKETEPLGMSSYALVIGKAPRGLRIRLKLAVLPVWLHVLRECDDEEYPQPNNSALAMQMVRDCPIL